MVHTRLAEALKYAREHVPLYSGGQAYESLARRDPYDLLSWPVLERETVRAERRKLVARRVLPVRFWRQSSQSSGAPVRVAINAHGAAWNWANEFRAMLWHGVPIAAKSLMLWRVNHPSTDWLKNCKVFLTGNMTRQKLDDAARFLIEKKPALLVGLPSAVAQFARYVRVKYPDAPPVLVPFAKVGGEQVYPFQREEIRKHLGARMVQFYGCTEVGAIAAECPWGSLHVFAANVCVEILRDREPVPPGAVGDIVITSLTNRAMPLVRYRVGDRGALSAEPCPCGLAYPVLTNLVGRRADEFYAPDGRRVHGSELGEGIGRVLATNAPESLWNLRFEQIDTCEWRVLVEGGREVSDTLADDLQDIVRTTFGAQCRVLVDRTGYIPREPSGKYRYYRTGASAAREQQQLQRRTRE